MGAEYCSTSVPVVYKDECTLCFDTQDSAGGLDICLKCFNGGCTDTIRQHGFKHYQKTGHTLALNIKRTLKPSYQQDSPKPAKISKLAIVEEANDEEKYQHTTALKCYACALTLPCDPLPEAVALAVTVINTSLSATKKSEIQSWEADDLMPCEHTLTLGPSASNSGARDHCHECDLTNNLWLCLTCGNVGCGRRHFDGSGGNNHGISHFEITGHPVACKLGTISPEGTADVYCYLCDDERTDPDLADHLAAFGINIDHVHKTDKSMAELQLEKNNEFDFSMTTEDGKQLLPLFGPGLTGLVNLGNSCYMASVLQCVMAIPAFRDRYFSLAASHPLTCPEQPARCFFCQTAKLAEGMFSGRYSVPLESGDNQSEMRGQAGISPRMFKMLIGAGHPDFATMQQQDAYEFFQQSVKVTHQKERAVEGGVHDPTKEFDFQLEERLQCLQCKRVRYTTVKTNALTLPIPESESPLSLRDCLDQWSGPESIEQYRCPHCRTATIAQKTVRFATFPAFLVLHMGRFQLINWVPQKVQTAVNLPCRVSGSGDDAPIDLERYRSHGQQPDEISLLEDSPQAEAPAPVDALDLAVLDQLMAMGFPEVRCRRALHQTGYNGAGIAMNWLLEHMDDPNIDTPLPTDGGNSHSAPGAGAASSSRPVDADQLMMLVGMGFGDDHATRALEQTGHDLERAIEWIFSHPEGDYDQATGSSGEGGLAMSGNPIDDGEDLATAARHPGHYQLQSFISHKGTSIHCGHYVAHTWHPEHNTWVLFNDNKVVAAPEPPVSGAYVYFLRREQS
ncbi:hypothetical protein BJ085DRAFT_19656 [Dimargaris cristalligena]|uniref:Ubiquitin carboxyl-terminal hydrolase n=1 Tax=Dimargaris cristalligena TaxID=215637 RepID=A0A4P9ZVU0_9FUNG|nr:hypothetical protein BJ085DRAFT_19656 [Dimargaris cristalligena]|eukprot:RKP37734.1 hypothetical protein BJ085DRAFT_19656 [Dimargaris cristalligena]